MRWRAGRGPGGHVKSSSSGCAICSCPCSRSRGKRRRSTGLESRCMAGSRNSSRSNWAIGRPSATCTNWTTTCGCRSAGPNGRMKPSAPPSSKSSTCSSRTPGVELWYGDECGIEGDPRPRRRWSARGSRPRVPCLGDHIRANVIGAVCPRTGQNFAMSFDGVDTDVFQCFLDHLAEAIPPEPGKRCVLILDNASWHKAARLCRHHFECRFLPGYSPDFNPIERLWLRLKADSFSDFIARTPDELTERLSTALNALRDDTKKVAAQCATRK